MSPLTGVTVARTGTGAGCHRGQTRANGHCGRTRMWMTNHHTAVGCHRGDYTSSGDTVCVPQDVPGYRPMVPCHQIHCEYGTIRVRDPRQWASSWHIGGMVCHHVVSPPRTRLPRLGNTWEWTDVTRAMDTRHVRCGQVGVTTTRVVSCVSHGAGLWGNTNWAGDQARSHMVWHSTHMPTGMMVNLVPRSVGQKLQSPLGNQALDSQWAKGVSGSLPPPLEVPAWMCRFDRLKVTPTGTSDHVHACSTGALPREAHGATLLGARRGPQEDGCIRAIPLGYTRVCTPSATCGTAP